MQAILLDAIHHGRCFEAGGFAQTQSSVKGAKRVVKIGIFMKPFDSKWMSGHFFKVGQIVIKKIEWDRCKFK